MPAKLHLLELVPFLAVLWLGIEVAGVAGAAAAWSGRVILDTILLMIAAKNSARAQAYLFPAAMFTAAAFAVASLLAMLALVTLGIKTLLEWKQAREFERAQRAIPESSQPLPGFRTVQPPVS